ncbi:hypothetical protein PaG_03789 [Moesziomyces aphidis]|uniref:Uncharacterized protein n=1 Tax=Moesziomyces aphidis TaxID=84754 RepID=W3VL01_MOEAP|nr:hypothetical protein PaG_03789 [Moesziomyces aphidis]
MQLIKSIALVAVLAVCFVHATILSDSVSLLEAHVKDAETLASQKAAFVRMVDRYYRPSAKAFWTQHAVPRAGKDKADRASGLQAHRLTLESSAFERALLIEKLPALRLRESTGTSTSGSLDSDPASSWAHSSDPRSLLHCSRSTAALVICTALNFVISEGKAGAYETMAYPDGMN